MIKRKYTKSVLIKIIAIALSITLIAVSTACNGTGLTSENEGNIQDEINTAVASTMTSQALDTQRTKGAEAALSPTETSAPTNTALPDTPTPEPSLTPAEAATDETPAAEDQPPPPLTGGPSVQVSVDTNCRSGPGKSYTWLGGLMVGESALLVGKDPSGQYWYINNPDQEGKYCWIWRKYASTIGNTAPLPVYTPGPTPTPEVNFSTDIHELETCGGAWQVEFTIVNNGSVVLHSVSTSVNDTVTGHSSGKSSVNSFKEKNGCAEIDVRDKREPGEKGYTVSRNLPSDPTGHLLFASIKVCTEDNLNGDCRTREFYFTP